MTRLFLGNFQNKLDAKMRVSVPAGFRVALRAYGDGLVMRASARHPCVEIWPAAEFEMIADALQRLDAFSETQEDLALSLFSETCMIETDKEGRIVLPEGLAAHAGLTDSVAFVGNGRNFQIWEPGAWQQRRSEAHARAGGLTIPAAASLVRAPTPAPAIGGPA